MIVVVSDTSPVLALHHLELLSLLGELYDRVLVPPAVEHELNSPPVSFSPLDLSAFPFLEVRAPTDSSVVAELLKSLDAGESEALALAAELQAVALMDEADGRKTAAQYGVRTLGTFGVLLEAKSFGKIAVIEPLMDRLIHEINFFVSDDVRRDVLKRAGE